MSTTPASGTHLWNIDPTHSSIDFSVKHLAVFTVRGSLGPVTGSAETTDGVISSVTLSSDATGITTNNAQRDGHLKSGDFLKVEEFPTIDFKSTSIDKKSDTEYSLTGDLTIAGKTAPVSVDLEVVAPTTDPWGNLRTGATGSGILHRKDWGITYNAPLEAGGVMISDEVKFTFDIQAVVAPA